MAESREARTRRFRRWKGRSEKTWSRLRTPFIAPRGPGLLEHVYEVCLAHELTKRGRRVDRQSLMPIVYDGTTFEEGLRFDLVIDDLVVCELKVVEELRPVHVGQVLSQLRLTNRRLGYLLNLNVELMSKGIRRVIR